MKANQSEGEKKRTTIQVERLVFLSSLLWMVFWFFFNYPNFAVQTFPEIDHMKNFPAQDYLQSQKERLEGQDEAVELLLSWPEIPVTAQVCRDT